MQSFSPQSSATREPTLQRYACDLTGKLRRDGHDGNKSVDIVEWLHWFAFGLAGKLAFTESYGQMENRSYSAWGQS
jgi:hypothetical protein